MFEVTKEEAAAGIEQAWEEIRQFRDAKIKDVEWRVMRNASEVRLGITPSDNLEALDVYIQELRDITNVSSFTDVVYPILGDIIVTDTAG